jgi:hypothetical protein
MRWQDVYQMMGDSLTLRFIRFGDTDIEATVEISRVGVDDFAVIFLGQPDAKRGLANGRGTGHHKDARGDIDPLVASCCRGRLVVASFHGTYYDDIESAAIGLTVRCRVIAGGSR